MKKIYNYSDLIATLWSEKPTNQRREVCERYATTIQLLNLANIYNIKLDNVNISTTKNNNINNGDLLEVVIKNIIHNELLNKKHKNYKKSTSLKRDTNINRYELEIKLQVTSKYLAYYDILKHFNYLGIYRNNNKFIVKTFKDIPSGAIHSNKKLDIKDIDDIVITKEIEEIKKALEKILNDTIIDYNLIRF